MQIASQSSVKNIVSIVSAENEKIGFEYVGALKNVGYISVKYFQKAIKQEATMKIYYVQNKTPQIIDTLLHIWENSVKATHSFLSDNEIEKIKSYVPQALKNVQNLVVAENENSTIVAFLGVENQRIEMLFITPEKRGQGIGKSLINFAVSTFSANEVTVNEQNTQAVTFYNHMGFETYKKTDSDEQGNAYPLLYKRLKN